MRYLTRLIGTIAAVVVGIPWATLVFFLATACYGIKAIWLALKGAKPAPKFQGGGLVMPAPFAQSQTSNRDPSWYFDSHPGAVPEPAPTGAQPKENDR